jgi:RimJ/RimL family protein N-acetyltransferase
LALVKHGHEASRIGLKLVFDKDKEVAEFVVSLLPQKMVVDEFGPFTTIGIATQDGSLIGGAVYHRWRSFDCELTFAASNPRWCKKGILRALFHYPFVQQKLDRMTLIIGENNPRAIKLNVGLGFRIEGRARKAYDGKNDAFVLGMLKDECKWIKE